MGYIKYQIEEEEVNFGDGNWYYTGNKRISDTVVGRYLDSSSCENEGETCYKLLCTYNNGRTYAVKYDGYAFHSDISGNDDWSNISPTFKCYDFYVKPSNNGVFPISGMTSAVIGDCVTALYSLHCYWAGIYVDMSPFWCSCRYPIYSANASSLTSLTIGNNVTYIGDNFFRSCSSLTSLSLPPKLTAIGNNAFNGCTSISSITIPNIQIIGDRSFVNCSSLKELTIPDMISRIGARAFDGCSGLTSITVNSIIPPIIPNRTSSGQDPFRNTNCCPIYVPCNYLDDYRNDNNWSGYYQRLACIGDTSYAWRSTMQDGTIMLATRNSANTRVSQSFVDAWNNMTKVEFTDYVESINNAIFSGCTNLKEVVISSGITMTKNTFGNCSSITDVITDSNVILHHCTSLTSCTLGSNVTNISNSGFSYCTSLTSITIPDSVTSIDKHAFYECSGLVRVNSNINGVFNIPDSVTSIGEYSFDGCSRLTSITIPSGVTFVGQGAFQVCPNLKSVIVNAITPPVTSRYLFPSSDFTIYVPAESVEVYKNAWGWNVYSDKIQAIPTP